MTIFLIKSSLCLFVFLCFYHLVLEREKMHQFNRFYLLVSIVISLVIPFLKFETIEIIPAVHNTESLFIDSIPITSNKIIIQNNINYLPIILWSLYILISSILIIRFARNIWKLISKTFSNPKIKYRNATLILLEEKTLPYTFLNLIYINFEDYNNRNIEDELFTHELVHVNQKHTLDILFVEFLKVIFWFNPLFVFYKKAIQLNHEFLADEEIVKTYNNVPYYQNLLLNKGIGTQTIYLASNLNYLITKKRLIMMTKNTSKNKRLAIITFSSFLFSSMILISCNENKPLISVVETQEIYEVPLVNVNTNDTVNVKEEYYKNAIFVFTDAKGDEKKCSFNELTKEQKKRIPPPPPSLEKFKMSADTYEKYKDNSKYAIWIDGVVVPNEKLMDYNVSDFVFSSESFVYKNARSERFPQEYQVSLYTEKGFEKMKSSIGKSPNMTIRFKN
ncbi:MAG: regulatory sensor-transducer, BlaR1/MecR1 family protein [Flavobacterium sp.]|nr:regulatory sensor-transducer, BlaR1/MecR1 family protein [Flavobacterium sp.]